MTTTTRKFAVAMLAIALLVSAGPALGQDAKLVRLTFGSGWDALPAIVGIERGFFAQEDLVVSGLAVTSPQAVISSLATGSTDVAAVPQQTLLLMAAAEVPGKVIGMNGWATAKDLIVPADNTAIQKVEDLKGKKIAVGRGSEAYPVLIRLLNASALTPADVTIVSLDGGSLLGAFKDNAADAIFETRYYTAAMLENGTARIAVADDAIRNTLGTIGPKPVIASPKFLQEDKETVQRFMNGWIKALIYIQQDPEDAARLMQIFFHRQGTPVQTDLAKSWVQFSRYDRYTWTPDDIADTEYNGWGLKEGNVLKVNPEIDGYIDNSYAEGALTELTQ